MEQLAHAPKTFSAPCLYNMASSGKTPDLSAAEMEDLGFGIAIFPGVAVSAAIPAMARVLRMLKDTGDIRPLRNELTPFANISTSWEWRRCRRSRPGTPSMMPPA